jgi:pimeloyl-ACP methyl ester carboxylesterase
LVQSLLRGEPAAQLIVIPLLDYAVGMAGMIELTGGGVWYDEQGQGEPLMLLHGGAVDARFFDGNVEELAQRFRVVTTDLWGHGRSPDREGPFSLESYATDVTELIERVAGGSAHVLGHSIGAAVALTLALRRPGLVRRLVLVSGGFSHEAEIGTEGGVTDEQVAQTVAFLGAGYGAVSPDGEEHFAVVVRKDFELSAREPELTAAEVGKVGSRTLVMVADDDVVSLDHTLELYRAIPDSELSVVPGTSHFLLREKPDLCNAIILGFLTTDPVPTVAPIRRAGDRQEG